ncbi:MAG: ribosomal protection-like ABC-F family protein [Anaerolineae bacterium]
MLQVSSISKAYGGNTVLDRVSFVVNAGERVGLIGPNGSGKTTLLRIITDHEQPDAGSAVFDPPDLRLGYLEQGLTYGPDDTLADVLDAGGAKLAQAEAELGRLGEALATALPAEQESLNDSYVEALATLERLATEQTDPHEAGAVLAGLGLAEAPLDTPVRTLSGGQKTRLGLARLLLRRPQLLLLDEPTNHLDIEALHWLEEWLRRFRGGVLIVSHDRMFLDRTVGTTLELDPDTHRITAYAGGYSDYIEVKQRERDKHWAAYKDQQEHIAHVTEEIRRLAHYADNIERHSIDFAVRKVALGIARRAVMQKRRLDRELDKDTIEKPKQSWQMKMDFGDATTGSQDVLTLEELAAGYNGVPLFAGLNEVLRAGERVALVGPNGAGKTTLMRVITRELAPLSGRARVGAGAKLGYLSQEQGDLDPDSDPLRTIRATAPMDETEARTFLHQFLFAGDDVFTLNRSLSFGERARLALARLVADGCNFLLLDEPINHLDIPSRARFEQAMAAFEGTVLAVVHDRYFIEEFASRIWLLIGGNMRVCYDLDDLEAKWQAAVRNH